MRVLSSADRESDLTFVSTNLDHRHHQTEAEMQHMASEVDADGKNVKTKDSDIGLGAQLAKVVTCRKSGDPQQEKPLPYCEDCELA